MDILNKIEKLAQKARQESTPDFSLSDRIMIQIEQRNGYIISFAAFDVLAGFFATAASIALFIGINTLISAQDPIVELFAQFQETSLW